MHARKPYIPLSQRLVRGAIGKRYVIKHYAYGVVKTRFPNMGAVVASDKQKACRNKFAALNAAVKAIYADPVQKAAWKVKLRNPPHLYRAIIKAYKRALELARVQRALATERLIQKSLKAVGEEEKGWYVMEEVLRSQNAINIYKETARKELILFKSRYKYLLY